MNRRLTKVVAVDATPSELGRYLRDRCDLVILGEYHGGKVLEANAELLAALKSWKLYIEEAPSKENLYSLARKEVPKQAGLGGQGPINYAHKNGITMKAVDLESFDSPEAYQVGMDATRALRGESGGFAFALTSVVKEARRNGSDLSRMSFSTNPLSATEWADRVIKIAGSTISTFNAQGLRKSAAILDRSENSGWDARILTAIDRAFLSERLKSENIPTTERDRAMAANIASDLRNPNRGGKVAALAVGSLHNDGVERHLERDGFRVANVKAEYTKFPELDGRLFYSISKGGSNRTEWVVVVHDPRVPSGWNCFDTSYTIRAQEVGVSKNHIGGGPRSK